MDRRGKGSVPFYFYYRRDFRRSSWAAGIKRIYEIDPLECPKRKAQMRIIAFIQVEHSIKDIMKSQKEFQTSRLLLLFLSSSILRSLSMKSPPTTPLSRRLMTAKLRFTCDGKAGVYLKCYFSLLSTPSRAPLGP